MVLGFQQDPLSTMKETRELKIVRRKSMHVRVRGRAERRRDHLSVQLERRRDVLVGDEPLRVALRVGDVETRQFDATRDRRRPRRRAQHGKVEIVLI